MRQTLEQFHEQRIGYDSPEPGNGVRGDGAADGSGGRVQAEDSLPATSAKRQTMTTQSKFHCNLKALNPTERTRHKQLTDKLIATRKEIVEMEKGYKFQFSPSDVSARELADWVADESKCCPFFDFHIDLEREGSILCLRLTGEEGTKAFIRVEFQLAAK
jgi:hypothetical protein